MCLEQILLGVRYLLHIAINDKPEWVKVALARKAYESKQALKFEVSRRLNISKMLNNFFFAEISEKQENSFQIQNRPVKLCSNTLCMYLNY